MADRQTERQTAMTPKREERHPARGRSFGWGSSPFSAMQRFADEIDRMFDDFGFGRRPGGGPLWREWGGDAWSPDIDVFQRDNELVIRADLPGLKRDDLSVEVTERSVAIEGERKEEREEEREGLYRSERRYGSFRRVIPLPEGALTDEAKATFRDGVLEVTMPAPPASRGRKLDIGAENKK